MAQLYLSVFFFLNRAIEQEEWHEMTATDY
jgi:hypothetical protein